ncbi:MAG: helix-turn-helix domain-containing protein [Acidimicrobiales bacterium]
MAASLAEATAALEVLRVQLSGLAPPSEQPGRAQGVQPKLLTVRQAAVALGVGQSTVHSLIRTGELGSRKIGGSRRVPVEELDAFIARLPGQPVGA